MQNVHTHQRFRTSSAAMKPKIASIHKLKISDGEAMAHANDEKTVLLTQYADKLATDVYLQDRLALEIMSLTQMSDHWRPADARSYIRKLAKWYRRRDIETDATLLANYL